MSVLVAFARLLLAAVFVVSAIAKLRDRDGSRESVQAFGVPRVLVGVVAAGLPVVELACSVLLVAADPAATLGAALSLLMLAVFTAAIAANLLRGRRPQCRCFGSIGGDDGIGWNSVARNAALMGLAGLAMVGAGSQGSVPAVLADLGGRAAAELALGTVATGLLIAMAVALRTLMGRYGTVLLRLEALEQATGTAPLPLAVDFALPDLDGDVVTLDDVLADGRPALLVFISPTCSKCVELLPDLAGWQGDEQHPLSVVVISDGTVAENRAKLADVGPLRVLLQQRYEIADAYDVQGTPGAALVGAEGRRAGDTVHAVGGVRSLHDSVVQAIGGGAAPGAPSGHVHAIGPRPVGLGDELPELALLDAETDSPLETSEALGSDSVLLFWRFDCGYCAGIVDDVRELESEAPVRLISGSDLAPLRASGLTSPVLRDPRRALEGWLRVPGTPSAVRVRDGILDSEVAVGGPDVLALIRASVRRDVSVD